MSSDTRLIIAILRDADGEEVLQALLDANFRVTRIASTGGFLRRGNSTLLIGVDKNGLKPPSSLFASTALQPSILVSNVPQFLF